MKIWNLFLFWNEFLNEAWNVNSLNRYHNQCLCELLTVFFCFFYFLFVYLVIVKFVGYSIQACNLFIDSCIVVRLLFRNKMFILISFQKLPILSNYHMFWLSYESFSILWCFLSKKGHFQLKHLTKVIYLLFLVAPKRVNLFVHIFSFFSFCVFFLLHFFV